MADAKTSQHYQDMIADIENYAKTVGNSDIISGVVDRLEFYMSLSNEMIKTAKEDDPRRNWFDGQIVAYQTMYLGIKEVL